jgi:cholesterol 7-desaturase
MNAYCPHLGANLAHGGGEIKDNCISCPFHGWKFDDKGNCVKIPYSEGTLPKVSIKVWESLEYNGQIYLWYHIDGEEPSWTPPKIDYEKMVNHGSIRQEISCHIQEIPENGADIAHLNVVHIKGVIFPSIFEHKWGGTWEALKDENSHKTKVMVDEKFYLFGKIYVPFSHITTEIYQVGPGLVNMYFNLPFGMKINVFQTVTPIKPFVQQVNHLAYSSWMVNISSNS